MMEAADMYLLALEEIEAAKWHKVTQKVKENLDQIWLHLTIFSLCSPSFSSCGIAKIDSKL